MATLDDKVIVFDDSCPMCRLYTYWFVAWGFLRNENRVGFANLDPRILAQLDLNRARHEIPLFDRRSGVTIYGLPALCFVLASRWTWLAPLFESRVFRGLMFPVYQFVTYNRRVMAGCRSCSGFDCSPDLNRPYRLALLLLAFTLAIGVLGLIELKSSVAWMAACLALSILAISVLLAFFTRGIRRWNLLGNCASILGMFSFVISPLIFLDQSSLISNAIILFATAMVGWEFHRRCVN
ncbi:MAG: hypothetical protein ABL888_23450 [Pirellulaceae bacterium]